MLVSRSSAYGCDEIKEREGKGKKEKGRGGDGIGLGLSYSKALVSLLIQFSILHYSKAQKVICFA